MDFQVIEIRDILPITNVQHLPTVVPPSILVVGRQDYSFNNAYEVLINEIKSPSVVVSNTRELIAQLPESQYKMAIRSVVVISNRLTNSERTKITFRIGDTTSGVDGITMLIQYFLKILLQTPGSDIFNPNLGGRLMQVVGKMAKANANSAVSDVQMAVNNTNRQIIALQANDPLLTLESRLLFARLLNADFVVREQSLVCKIQVANQAGQTATSGLVI